MVIAVGTCACSGGVFHDCYNMLGGMDKAIPVDVYVPGCAARPESIIDGVVKGLSVLEEKQKALAVPAREKQALREKELEPEMAISKSQEAGK